MINLYHKIDVQQTQETGLSFTRQLEKWGDAFIAPSVRQRRGGLKVSIHGRSVQEQPFKQKASWALWLIVQTALGNMGVAFKKLAMVCNEDLKKKYKMIDGSSELNRFEEPERSGVSDCCACLAVILACSGGNIAVKR